MAVKSRGGPLRHMELKGQTWWFRREVPAACRAAEGRGRFIRENLHIDAVRVAQARRDELERETDARWSDMRAGRYVPAVGMTPAQRGASWRETLTALERAHPRPASDGSPRVPLWTLSPEEQEEAMADDPLDLALRSEEDQREAMRGPEKRAYEAALEGDLAVGDHLEAYLAGSPVTPKTRKSRRGQIGRLAAWAAVEGLTLSAITRKEAGRFYREKLAPMDDATRRNYLQALRGYWSYLHAHGLYAGGDKHGAPWTDLEPVRRGSRAERGDRDKEERPFAVAEVRTLLYSPWPAGMDSAHHSQVEDALRVSLLSGLRVSEVLALWVGDVEGGAFDIKEGKTASAARRFPIHSALAELVRRRSEGKQAGDLLFHELAGERDPGDTFGKRFRRYRVALGVADKREGRRRSLVNFHSARRWFITEARHAGHTREDIADVVGHAPDRGDLTFGTYTAGASWARRQEVVESVRLPVPGAAPKVAPAAPATGP